MFIGEGAPCAPCALMDAEQPQKDGEAMPKKDLEPLQLHWGAEGKYMLTCTCGGGHTRRASFATILGHDWALQVMTGTCNHVNTHGHVRILSVKTVWTLNG